MADDRLSDESDRRRAAGEVKPRQWRDAVRDSNLDATTKVVAFTLSTYMNGRGEAFPSKETLAAGSGKSKRATDGAIERLASAGFVLISKSRGRSSNRYRATLPTLQSVAGFTVRADAPLEALNRATAGTGTLQDRTANGAAADALTLQVAAPESDDEVVVEGRVEGGARLRGAQQGAAARASDPPRKAEKEWGTADCAHKGCAGLERCQYDNWEKRMAAGNFPREMPSA